MSICWRTHITYSWPETEKCNVLEASAWYDISLLYPPPLVAASYAMRGFSYYFSGKFSVAKGIRSSHQVAKMQEMSSCQVDKKEIGCAISSKYYLVPEAVMESNQGLNQEAVIPLIANHSIVIFYIITVTGTEFWFSFTQIFHPFRDLAFYSSLLCFHCTFHYATFALRNLLLMYLTI